MTSVLSSIWKEFEGYLWPSPSTVSQEETIPTPSIYVPPPPSTPRPINLHEAAAAGNATLVQSLVSYANVNARDGQGKTPIHYAKDPIIITFLLNAGAKIALPQQIQSTPEHIQAFSALLSNGDLVGVKEYLEAGEVSIHTQFEQNKMALHLAIRHSSIVLLLLAAGAKIETKDVNGLTPFLTALKAGRSDVAGILVEANCDLKVRDLSGSTGLHYAGQHAFEKLIKRLTENGLALTDRNKDGKTPLHCIAASSRSEGKDIILDFVGKKGLSSIFELLTTVQKKRGLADLEALIDPLLAFTDDKTSEKGLEFIFSYKGDQRHTQECYKILLFFCADRLFAQTLKSVLIRGANPDLRDSQNRTPLHKVIFLPQQHSPLQVEAARTLLKARADVNARMSYLGIDDVTPLHLAAMTGNSGMVDLLLAYDADCTLTNGNGETAKKIAKEEVYSQLRQAYSEQIRRWSWKTVFACLTCCCTEDWERRDAAIHRFNLSSITDEQWEYYKAEQEQKKKADEQSSLLFWSRGQNNSSRYISPHVQSPSNVAAATVLRNWAISSATVTYMKV